MAQTATMYHLEVALSDVDRGVYEALDLRVAQHPSESARHLLLRVLAYGLAYEEGIQFSREGVSSTEEPALSVRDLTGTLHAWIEVGAPSAERLHKATKAAPRVAVYTHHDLALLQRQASARPIHRAQDIEVWHVEPSLLDELEGRLTRSAQLELVRTEGRLYVTLGGVLLEGELLRASLV